MLAQYLVLVGAVYSRKSKRTGNKAVHSPQTDKKRTLRDHLLVENA